jgi:uncharacterized membrane protein required for colicin V production
MNCGYHTTLQFVGCKNCDVSLGILFGMLTIVRMLVADSIFLCIGFLTFKRELYWFFPNPG